MHMSYIYVWYIHLLRWAFLSSEFIQFPPFLASCKAGSNVTVNCEWNTTRGAYVCKYNFWSIDLHTYLPSREAAWVFWTSQRLNRHLKVTFKESLRCQKQCHIHSLQFSVPISAKFQGMFQVEQGPLIWSWWFLLQRQGRQRQCPRCYGLNNDQFKLC